MVENEKDGLKHHDYYMNLSTTQPHLYISCWSVVTQCPMWVTLQLNMESLMEPLITVLTENVKEMQRKTGYQSGERDTTTLFVNSAEKW